ncbi:aminomethyltransferase [Corynebacterium phocae]|uniref:Aminomethyltransferase n=1 Tax=Corynebacterium phocae TaxID=161895 RepID=A0A1L7D6J9_9CORY|nr:folate-binding protein YgfZ [Corynebacterium phocae]APT93613.1 aminomethyltransferase [Corynebacterium phocae]KAA8726949.1 folate-binding protein YgfZ [Corynebacterium phocae]
MTYASPLLTRAGAATLQEDSPIDAAGVAWHYGNPLVEQRFVEDSGAIIDRSHRRVISVAGPDAPSFLNNLLSQKLDDTAPGYSAQALDMDIQGRILHTMGVAVSKDGTFYLDTPAAEFPSLLDYLTKMIFWSQVTVAEADIAVLSVLGAPLECSAAVFARTLPPATELAAPQTDFGVPRGELETAVAELEGQGGKLAGLMAYTAQRVRAREPELAADLDSKAIAHEVPQWIGRAPHPGAVHLNKGCYRGQETVARVENIGRSPRLLVMVYLDGSAPTMPIPGADITSGGRRVGRLGTVVDDCDFGPVALALVKRSALGGPLQIGDVAAAVEQGTIPQDEGPKAGRAAQQRLRGR